MNKEINYKLEALIRLGLFEDAQYEILINDSQIEDITQEAYQIYKEALSGKRP